MCHCSNSHCPCSRVGRSAVSNRPRTSRLADTVERLVADAIAAAAIGTSLLLAGCAIIARSTAAGPIVAAAMAVTIGRAKLQVTILASPTGDACTCAIETVLVP